ncbi:MAG: hypothetical protein ABI316_00235 [Casimicrobiaceae bacterium]
MQRRRAPARSSAVVAVRIVGIVPGIIVVTTSAREGGLRLLLSRAARVLT